MIYRSKTFELDIIDFEYHYDQTRSVEIIPSQTSNP